jgi:hypothetical protein
MKRILIATIWLCMVACGIVNAQTGISASGITSGSMAYNLSSKENTKGSRYLFDDWTKGYVTDVKGNPINSENYTFNYDKIGGTLLLSQDKQTAIAVDKEHVKNFVVYKADKAMAFEYVPAIDATHYCEILATGARYKIYKLIKTKLVKADFKSDGMTSSGNKYDEYIDEPAYFVIDVKSAQPQQLGLKSKAIKQVFAADADKVKTFFTDHKDDDIDETFLSEP